MGLRWSPWVRPQHWPRPHLDRRELRPEAIRRAKVPPASSSFWLDGGKYHTPSELMRLEAIVPPWVHFFNENAFNLGNCFRLPFMVSQVKGLVEIWEFGLPQLALPKRSHGLSSQSTVDLKTQMECGLRTFSSFLRETERNRCNFDTDHSIQAIGQLVTDLVQRKTLWNTPKWKEKHQQQLLLQWR